MSPATGGTTTAPLSPATIVAGSCASAMYHDARPLLALAMRTMAFMDHGPAQMPRSCRLADPIDSLAPSPNTAHAHSTSPQKYRASRLWRLWYPSLHTPAIPASIPQRPQHTEPPFSGTCLPAPTSRAWPPPHRNQPLIISVLLLDIARDARLPLPLRRPRCEKARGPASARQLRI
ncbi:hypothetical protein C8R47DRAFT_1225470 [Mycena vitilis]|nr:hypothetical protein C8R47DRAFT_1231215 [Mycena vitilis]KAJ6462687.1 hypothetical protein C8R47DRAFT_1225470 [Mycena vitilis]